MSEETKEIVEKETIQNLDINIDEKTIKSLIYVVRGQQVMLAGDLAFLYGVETRTLNQAVKRNIARFPDGFRFQLTEEEYMNLKSQFVISSLECEGVHGGRRYLPYGILAYHIGASLKDAGKKCFAINRIEDSANIRDILNRLTK